MLLEKDYTGKVGTRYKCDRCGDDLPNPRSKRYRVSVNVSTPSRYSHQLKAYDLCRRCASLVCAAIDKGIPKNNKEKENTNERSK